jgi:hypothetical protein
LWPPPGAPEQILDATSIIAWPTSFSQELVNALTRPEREDILRTLDKLAGWQATGPALLDPPTMAALRARQLESFDSAEPLESFHQRFDSLSDAEGQAVLVFLRTVRTSTEPISRPVHRVRRSTGTGRVTRTAADPDRDPGALVGGPTRTAQHHRAVRGILASLPSSMPQTPWSRTIAAVARGGGSRLPILTLPHCQRPSADAPLSAW